MANTSGKLKIYYGSNEWGATEWIGKIYPPGTFHIVSSKVPYHFLKKVTNFTSLVLACPG